jgi:carboxyl-terminal processing protease
MTPRRSTLLALVTGTALGFALAVSGGVLASRVPDAAALPGQDTRLMAEVIERVKQEYVDPVDDHELMQFAIRGMVAGLDAHSAFLDEGELEDLRIASEGRYAGIGIEVSYEDGSIVVIAPIEGSPAERAGLVTGDRIVAIDGHEVKSGALADSVDRMRGEPGTPVRVTVERAANAEPLEFRIERAEIAVQSVRQAMLAPGWGYLRISRFSETTPLEVERAVDGLRAQAGGRLQGAVLDLRGNPGGVLEAGVAVADGFLDAGLIVSATGRTADARFRMAATEGDLLDGAPLAVLVDGGSASASEIVAGALRDNGRATLVGRTTFGKGSVQTIVPLSAGRAVKLTTSRYFTPAGTSIHERGIDPDVVLARQDAAPAARDPAGDPEVAAALAQLQGRGPRGAGQRRW